MFGTDITHTYERCEEDNIGLPKSLFLGMIEGDTLRIIGKAADGTTEELFEIDRNWVDNHKSAPHNAVRKVMGVLFSNVEVVEIVIEAGWNRSAKRHNVILWEAEEAKFKELLADTATPEGYDFSMVYPIGDYTAERLAKIVKAIREYRGGSTFWARVTPIHNDRVQLEIYHVRGIWEDCGTFESYAAIAGIMINTATI